MQLNSLQFKTRPRPTAARWLRKGDEVALYRSSITPVRSAEIIDELLNEHPSPILWVSVISPMELLQVGKDMPPGSDIRGMFRWTARWSDDNGEVHIHRMRSQTEDEQYIYRETVTADPWDVDSAIRAADQQLLEQLLADESPGNREVGAKVIELRARGVATVPKPRVAKDDEPELIQLGRVHAESDEIDHQSRRDSD